MCDLGPAISTPIRSFLCRAWRLYHRQWMVIIDSFRHLILPGLFRIGVNGRRHFGRRPVVTLRVSPEPSFVRRFSCGDSLPHDISARAWFGVSWRFMAQTALEPYLMLVPYDLVSTEEE